LAKFKSIKLFILFLYTLNYQLLIKFLLGFKGSSVVLKLVISRSVSVSNKLT